MLQEQEKGEEDVLSWHVVTNSPSSCIFIEWKTRLEEASSLSSSRKQQQNALSYLRQLMCRWQILSSKSSVWSTKDNEKKKFAWRKHVEYVCTLGEKTESLEYYLTEHLRMSGVYWGLGTLGILGATQTLDRDALIRFVKSCECKNGGFAGNMNHDPHLLYTLSAVQILAMIDALEYVDADRVMNYVASLQQPDGSFAGDEWLEIDTRFFLLCSVLSCHFGKIETNRCEEMCWLRHELLQH